MKGGEKFPESAGRRAAFVNLYIQLVCKLNQKILKCQYFLIGSINFSNFFVFFEFPQDKNELF